MRGSLLMEIRVAGNIFCFCPKTFAGICRSLAVLFFFLAAPYVSHVSALSDDEVVIEKQEIVIPDRGRHVNWLIHRHLLGIIPGRNHANMTFRSFKDETLLRETDLTRRLEEELQVISDAGFVSLLQREGFFGLRRALGNDGMKYALLSEYSPQRMASHPPAGKATPEGVISELVDKLKYHGGYGSVYRRNGRPVMICYYVTTFEAHQWREIIRSVREEAEDAVFIFHTGPIGNLLSSEDPHGLLKSYFDVFDGVLFWGGRVEQKSEALDIARGAADEFEKRKLIYFAVTSGYWRPEKGMYRCRRGTKDLREEIHIGLDNTVDGILLESWDDFGENTQIQPSMMNHTALMDIIKWYIAAGNNESRIVSWPGLYISHRREVLRGEFFNVELLALPTGGGDRELILELNDPDGRLIYESRPLLVTGDAAYSVDFQIPTAGFSGYVRASVRCGSERYETPMYAQVRECWLRLPFERHSTLALALRPETVRFEINGKGPGESVSWRHQEPLEAFIEFSSPVEIERLEVVRNFKTFYGADWHKAVGDDMDSLVYLRLDWATPTRHEGESLDFSGELTLNGGEVAAAFCSRDGRDYKKNSSRVAWERYGIVSGVEIAVLPEDGKQPEINIDFPAHGRNISLKFKELARAPWLSYEISPHSRLRVQLSGPAPGAAEPLKTKSYRSRFRLPPPAEGRVDSYHLRVTGSDGSLYRSWPVEVKSFEEPEPVRAYIWDEAEGRRSAVEFESGLPAARWDFEETGRYAWDSGQLAMHGELGGSHLRDGRYSTGAEPERVESPGGRSLQFGGSDYVFLGPGLMPYGAFEFNVRLMPDRPGEGEQAIFYAPFGLYLTIDEAGRPVAVYGQVYGGVGTHVLSPVPLKAGRWYDISVIYDLNQLILMVDGRQMDSSPRGGFKGEPVLSHTAWLGSELSVVCLSPPQRQFYGQIEYVELVPGVAAD